jgi:hypothetical protein
MFDKKVGDRKGEGRACGSMGSAFHSLGQFEKSLEYHQKHLSISIELGDNDGRDRASRNTLFVLGHL